MVPMLVMIGCLRGGGVGGVVRGPEGKALQGATVSWTADGEDSTAATAVDGTFRVMLENLSTFRSASLTVSLDGYQTAREDIGDGPWDCTVTLQPLNAAVVSAITCKNLE